MLRRTVEKVVVLAWALGGGIGLFAAPPNVLIILTDDQGYNDVSANGPSDVRTPHIDRLAKEGMLFPNMRSNCTVCAPSRAAIMTGLFPDRVGVPGLIRDGIGDTSWGYFRTSVPTLADVLRGQGYHTALIGKWNLGLTSPNLPNERGFDLFHGFLSDMMDSYTTHLRHGINYMRLNLEVIDPKGHATDLFTDWACAYLRERAKEGKPFFLYLAYTAPHFPIEPPAEWLARVKARAPGLSDLRAKNVALVEHLDAGIGRVLDVLDETGLASDTLVAFASDNGGSLPHGSCNFPWRDGKQSHYDGGLRIPFMIRWPAVVPAGSRCDYEGQTFDVFPTCAEAAGAPVPVGLDAVSLMPVLKGGTLSTPNRELYFVRREGGPKYGGKSYEAVVCGEWKLMQNDPYSPLELYHLTVDPQETNDLSRLEPQRMKTLSERLQRHIQIGGAVPWEPPE